MKLVQEFVEVARKNYETHPFIERYKNQKLKYIEVVGTFLFNQVSIVSTIEHFAHELGITKDFPEVYIANKLREEYEKNWPFEYNKEDKPFVAPAFMFTSEEYCTYLKSIKDDREKILSHLWAIHSEIHKNQKSSVLLDKLNSAFEEAFNGERRNEMLEEVKVSWTFKQQLLGDMEAHEDYWANVKPLTDMANIAVKEIAKKEGEDETGGKDETEDAMVRAGLMANAVRFKTIDLDNVPEEYKELVESDLKEQKKKEEELKKTLEEAPTR